MSIKNSKNEENQIMDDIKFKINLLKKKLNKKDFHKKIKKIIK